MKETPWPIMVASAAPLLSHLKTPTKRRSSPIFSSAATEMNMKGRLESPMPRNMALTVLYPNTKNMPEKPTIAYCLAWSSACGQIFYDRFPEVYQAGHVSSQYSTGDKQMFYYLDGIISLPEPGIAVVDCSGVGYKCFITQNTR